MSATAANRQKVARVELAMEILANALEERAIDARGDELRGGIRDIGLRLRDWIAGLVAKVPGATRAWARIVGLVERTRQYDLLDGMEDERRERVIASARELCRLLDERTERSA